MEAVIDDLRVYGACLSEEDISNLYGSGGDFNRLELIGAGQTRVMAKQKAVLNMKRLYRYSIISRWFVFLSLWTFHPSMIIQWEIFLSGWMQMPVRPCPFFNSSHQIHL